MPLVRLIYISTAQEWLSDEDLDSILDSSVRHNTAHDIMGMLLFSAGDFIQVLEGELSDVEETFRRICADTRQRNIYLITKGPIPTRQFATWRMGFRRLTVVDVQSHPAYASLFENGFSAEVLSGEEALGAKLLREFSKGIC